MHKLVQLMVASTNLGPKSRFLDVGSGLGKPNLHVAQYPGVKVSIGIELKRERWMLSLANLKACLKTAVADAARHGPDPSGGRPADPASDGRVKGNTIFIQGDITKARTFDPFTHVYMFSVGFPPDLWERLATIWNNSNPNTCKYLICFSPEKKMKEYDFAVEIVAEADTTMHGSGEHHTVYLYKRSKPPADWCDPLFQSSYNLVKKGGLNRLKSFVDEQLNTEESCKRSRRSACMEESFVEDSSIDSSESVVEDADDEEGNLLRAQPKKKRRRRRKRRRKNTTTTKRVSRRNQGLQPELGPELERPPRPRRRRRRRVRARAGVRDEPIQPPRTRRSTAQVFLDEIVLRRNGMNYRKDLSSLSSQRLTQRIDWLVSLICAACAGKTEVKAMTQKETRKTGVPFLSSTLGLVFIARVKETFEAITKSIEKKLDIEIGLSGVDIMRIDAFALSLIHI